MDNKQNEVSPREYVEVLYGKCDHGNIVFVKPNRKQVSAVYSVTQLDEAAFHIETHPQDLFLKVNVMDHEKTIASNPYGIGGNDQVEAIVSLHLDVDAGKSDKYLTPEKALKALDSMPHKPSLVIQTDGETGGFHAYWLLYEPHYISNEDDRERCKKLSKAWKAELLHQAKQQLTKEELKTVDERKLIDSTQDLCRVLRPIGSLRKSGNRVAAYRWEPSKRYRLEDLAVPDRSAPEPKFEGDKFDGDSPIEKYLKANNLDSVEAILRWQNYEHLGGAEWLRPNSESGARTGEVFVANGEEGFTVKSGAADPLSCENPNGGVGNWYSKARLWATFHIGVDVSGQRNSAAWQQAVDYCKDWLDKNNTRHIEKQCRESSNASKTVDTQQSEPAATKTSKPPAIKPQEPFPVELLPPIVRDYIVEGAESRACDVSVVALPVLVTLASCIGTTRRIEAKRGWCEPSILWGIVVARSGSLKSPGIDLARDLIEQGERDAKRQHDEDLQAFRIEWLRYERELSEWKRGGKKSESLDPPDSPDPPKAERLRVDDTTVEAIAPILQENPRGLIVLKDELRGWFDAMGCYQAKSSGKDEAKWLEWYHARPSMVDRKTGRERVYIPMASVSVTGTIQPNVLAHIAKDELRVSSGLLARILCVMPEPRQKRWTDAEMDDAVEAKMVQLAERLKTLKHIVVHEDLRPLDLQLTTTARRRFARFVNQHGGETIQQAEAVASAYSKLEGAALRFALVFHLCRWSAGEDGYSHDGPIDLPEIESGIELARWFADEAERVYRTIGVRVDADNKVSENRYADRLHEWLVGRGRATEREIRKNLIRYKQGEYIDEDCRALVEARRAYWDSQPKTRYLVAISPEDITDTTDTYTFAKNTGEIAQVSEIEGTSVGDAADTSTDTWNTENRHLHENTRENRTSGSVGAVSGAETKKRKVI